MPDNEYLYAAPFFSCPASYEHLIPLPYPDLPEITEAQWKSTEDVDLLKLPPDTWTSIFGCRECGLIHIYDTEAIEEHLIERVSRGRYHNDANCFSVELQCANLNCKSPARLHVNMKDGEHEKDLLRLLKSSFFHGCLPCRHDLMPIPDRFYRNVHRVPVTECLW